MIVLTWIFWAGRILTKIVLELEIRRAITRHRRGGLISRGHGGMIMAATIMVLVSTIVNTAIVKILSPILATSASLTVY